VDKPSPQKRSPYSRNWALQTGSVLVLLVLVMALFGPLLAPKDPLQESYIAEFEGRFLRPPFPPGVEGYPFGSDEFGRDVLSRLLWAVRPTMILVVVVAALRLSMGFIAGLLSGWSSGRLSRAVDTLISSSLAIPVLFVALCIIAAFASKWGVWAFVLGLSITGWAEAARLVQEQTRSIKAQPFIEATQALGAGSGQVVISHVIPHILPLMLIQLAFEVSGTLLTTAALGFLGYFVNAVWIPIEDFTGLRASGAPELGQMLGVSTRNQPWSALLAGTMVFVVVLAFNLLGEGLRVFLSPERRRRKAEAAQAVDRAGSWIEERVYFAVTEWRRTATTGGVFGLLLLVIFGGGWIIWSAQNSGRVLTKISPVGGHLWAAELRDSQATYWSSDSGPKDPAVRWVYTGEQNFIGGPVIDRDGNLYITGKNGKLISLDSTGVERWQADLPADPVGWPALSPDGEVVVADVTANLYAFSPQGELLWTYQSDPPDAGLSSPIVGPTGIIYYSIKNFIVAVSPQGERLWQIRIPTYSYTSALPRLSPKGDLLFFENVVIEADTGVTLLVQDMEPMNKFLIGADGSVYFRTSEKFYEWSLTKTSAVMVQQAQIDPRVLGTSYRFPYDSGISPARHPWLLYSSGFEYPRMVWFDPKGQSPQVADFPYRPSRLIGMDVDGIAYTCGILRQRDPVECRAVRLETATVIWKSALDTIALPVGGSLAEGTLYVVSGENKVFALGK
jgi:ABC-type dipeptide/oligopeptide/nickel transport system permease subunit